MCEYCYDDPHDADWAEHKRDHMFNPNYNYEEDDDCFCEYCDGMSPPPWITAEKIVNDYVIATDAVARLFTDDERMIRMWYKAMVPVDNLSVETVYPEVERYGIRDKTLPFLYHDITVMGKNGEALEKFRVDDLMYFITEFPDDPERSKASVEFYVLGRLPAALPHWFFPTFQDIYALNAQFDKAETEKSGEDYVKGLQNAENA